MAAPSKNWTAITDGQVDAKSPLDETLMTAIRDNLVHLEEWLGDGFTAAKDHDHDGTNSKEVVTLGAASVAQAELKTTTGEVSNSSTPVVLTLPGGQYGFYPQIKMNTTNARNWTACMMNNDLTYSGFTTYATVICLGSSSSTIYAKQRYIQSSPPYKIGGVEWGHFLFLLVNSTGDVVSAYEAPDPSWGNNGALWLPKDDVGRVAACPHPFVDYWEKDPVVDGLEIVLVDLRGYDTAKWRADNEKLGKGIIEDLGGKVDTKGAVKTFASLGIPDIPGFTDRVKVRARA